VRVISRLGTGVVPVGDDDAAGDCAHTAVLQCVCLIFFFENLEVGVGEGGGKEIVRSGQRPSINDKRISFVLGGTGRTARGAAMPKSKMSPVNPFAFAFRE